MAKFTSHKHKRVHSLRGQKAGHMLHGKHHGRVGRKGRK